MEDIYYSHFFVQIEIMSLIFSAASKSCQVLNNMPFM